MGKEGVLLENIWFPWISLVYSAAVLSAVRIMKSLYSIPFIHLFCLLVKISERETLNEFQSCFVKCHVSETGGFMRETV